MCGREERRALEQARAPGPGAALPCPPSPPSSPSQRDDVNRNFFGRDVDPSELFDGSCPAPTAAAPLYHKLAEYESICGIAHGFFSSTDDHLVPHLTATRTEPIDDPNPAGYTSFAQVDRHDIKN